MAPPYRDDRARLRERLAALDAQLRDAHDLPERRRVLEETRQRLESQRAELARELRDRGANRPLEALRVASPCQADWGAMVGDERVRFCGQCQKNVYNLSAMARAEAEALLQRAEGKLCVRMYKRADGTLITGDCPDGVRRKQRRRLALAAGGAALSASAAAYAGFSASRGETEVGKLEAHVADVAPAEVEAHVAEVAPDEGSPSPAEAPPPVHELAPDAAPSNDPAGEAAQTAPAKPKQAKPIVLMGDIGELGHEAGCPRPRSGGRSGPALSTIAFGESPH